jgi:hypothetical protein
MGCNCPEHHLWLSWGWQAGYGKIREYFIFPCGKLRGQVDSFARHATGVLARQILFKIIELSGGFRVYNFKNGAKSLESSLESIFRQCGVTSHMATSGESGGILQQCSVPADMPQ